MLDDQTFERVPVMLVGPEMFYKESGLHHLDFEAIKKFSAKFCRFTVMHFIYATLEISKVLPFHRAVMLTKMGVSFIDTIVLDPNSTDHQNKMRDLQVALAFAYAPELHQVMPFRQGILLEGPKETIIGALEHFTDSSEPFSEARFRELTKTVYG